MKSFAYFCLSCLSLSPFISSGYFSFGDFNEWPNQAINQPMEIVSDHYLFEFESGPHNQKAFHDILFIKVDNLVHGITTKQNNGKHKGMLLFENGVDQNGEIVFPVDNKGNVVYTDLNPNETSSRHWWNEGKLTVTFALEKNWFDNQFLSASNDFYVSNISGNGVSPYNHNDFEVDSFVLIPELSSIYYVLGFIGILALLNARSFKKGS